MASGSIAIEAPLFGVLAVWLLGAVPAAVVTLLKDDWGSFLGGFLSFGLIWFIGALALAPAGSPWARWFYGERQLDRVRDPIRHGRRPVVTLAWVAVAGAVTLGLGALCARPAPVLGVNGVALQQSVSGSNSAPCHHRDGEWTCIYGSSSDAALYRVRVYQRGCWTAVPVRASFKESQKRVHGCITAFDYALS